jgi:O-antigen ligase
MELLLLKLVAVLRPLASMKYAENYFEIVGVGLFALMIVGIFSYCAVRKTLTLSAIDLLIFAFAIWCLTIYLAYFEVTGIKSVVVILIPLFSYIVVKNVVKDRVQYLGVLFWIIVGFIIPVILSAVLIVTGKGVDYVSYWTGITRWQGVYTHSHNLGHSMTLFLITLVLYLHLSAENGDAVKSRKATHITFAVLAAVAIYCLYMSQVRSAILGLMVFVVMYLYAFNKKLLIVGATALTVAAVLSLPYWMPVLLPDVWLMERSQDTSLMGLGSGRPRFWLGDLQQFAALPVDQLLSGFGIGREYKEGDLYLMGHSDWLEILTNTGIIGFMLFATLQIFIFRAILKMQGREKYIFLAMFFAVNMMMLVSNSYTWRIQVSHLFYILLAYIEIPDKQIQSEKTIVAAIKAA